MTLRDDFDNGITFTVNEQNCLAMLCEIMSAASYAAKQSGVNLPLKTENDLFDLFDRFPNINWGMLYDKFHRQGKNR